MERIYLKNINPKFYASDYYIIWCKMWNIIKTLAK